jgi:hypothetical protein
MKRRFLLLGAIALMSSAALNAQVTIGSGEMPNATLDVVATDGSTPNGLIAPRVTRLQLNTFDGDYKAAQTGAIVYVNDATAGTATNKAINVNIIGYYYFDGNVWQKLSGEDTDTKYGSSESILMNSGNYIYRAALTGDATADENKNATRVVALQGKPVAATAPAVGDVLVWDGNAWVPQQKGNAAYEGTKGSANVAMSQTYKYMGCYVDVPAGRSQVMFGAFINGANANGYVTFSLSSSATVDSPIPGVAPGLAGINVSGGNTASTGQGRFYITSDTAKRVYLWGRVAAATTSANFINLGVGETFIYCAY